MNVDSILVSQFAVVDPGNALTVVRTFNSVQATSLPARMGMMSISIIIHAHPSEGGTVHEFELVLMSAKQGRVASLFKGEFTLSQERVQPGMPIRQILVLNAMQAEFPVDGPYAFELYIDGTYYAAASMYIGLVEKS